MTINIKLYESDSEGPVYTDENGILRWVYGDKPVEKR